MDSKLSKNNLMSLDVSPSSTFTNENKHSNEKLEQINEAIVTKMEYSLSSIIADDLKKEHIISNDVYFKLNKKYEIYEDDKDKSSLQGEILKLLEEYRKEYMYFKGSKIKDDKQQTNILNGAITYMKSTGVDEKIIKKFMKTVIETGTSQWEKYTDITKAGNLSKVVIHKIVDDNFFKIVNRQKYQLPIKDNMILDLEYDEPLIRRRGHPEDIPAEITKHPEQKKDYFTYYLNYKYKPRNKQNKKHFEMLDKYILDLSTGNQEKAKFLKTILGSILIKGNPSQKFFLFTGSGSNGKSMLLNIINELFDDLKLDIQADMIVDTKGKTKSGADPFLIEMNDPKKRLMVVSETKDGINFDDALIKRLTGDDNIKSRLLYSNKTQQFKVDSKLITVSNHRPRFNVYDYGMKRRPIAFDFNSTFVDGQPEKKGEYKKDPELFKKIMENKDILFSWFVEGALLYKKNMMFEVPKIIKEETENYFYELDSVSQYLDESSERVIITGDNKDRIQQSHLYNDFVSFCKTNNATISKKSTFLTSIGKKLETKKIRGIIHVVGIKWVDEDGDDISDLI